MILYMWNLKINKYNLKTKLIDTENILVVARWEVGKMGEFFFSLNKLNNKKNDL